MLAAHLSIFLCCCHKSQLTGGNRKAAELAYNHYSRGDEVSILRLVKLTASGVR